jgi:exosortase
MQTPIGKMAAIGLALASFVFLFWNVFQDLIRDWTNDGNYSHGFLIVPLAAYFVWERRHKLSRIPAKPATAWGLAALIGSVSMLLVGLLGAELFVTRVALIGALGGAVLFLWGWAHLRALIFPLAFLLLMIPIPSIIFNQVALPLQLLASRVGEWTLQTANIPVLREGNIIILANTTLEVAEACSGIRSLVSLLTLGIIYGYFADPRGWVRLVIALSTIPIAIVTNGARVAGTGLAAHYYGPEAAEGFFHDFSGWALFVVAFALMFVMLRLVARFAPKPPVLAAQES